MNSRIFWDHETKHTVAKSRNFKFNKLVTFHLNKCHYSEENLVSTKDDILNQYTQISVVPLQANLSNQPPKIYHEFWTKTKVINYILTLYVRRRRCRILLLHFLLVLKLLLTLYRNLENVLDLFLFIVVQCYILESSWHSSSSERLAIVVVSASYDQITADQTNWLTKWRCQGPKF